MNLLRNSDSWPKIVREASLLATLLAGSAHAEFAFLTVPDVVIGHEQGHFRFCPAKDLKGRLCSERVPVFRKELQLVRDWWSALEYVEAVTGDSHLQVTQVTPDATGKGIVIYYRRASPGDASRFER